MTPARRARRGDQGEAPATPTIESVLGWAEELDAVAERLGKHFARSEPSPWAGVYFRGLLSTVERKNGWQLAEHARVGRWLLRVVSAPANPNPREVLLLPRPT